MTDTNKDGEAWTGAAMNAREITGKLTAGQQSDLSLLCFSNGRLNVAAFEGLPSELIDPRAEGGLFRQAYPSPLGLEVRAILEEQPK